jgi:predicted RNase H-related nuclease YkuK (DUF458 family)
MEPIFRSLTTLAQVDLIQYVKDFIGANEGTCLYVGCDSQNFSNKTIYATVIVLYNKGKGGHVLYTKETLPKITDRYTRLWREIEKSLEVADYLTANGISKPDFIDVDLNPDPKYKSNQLLRAALGYVESMGYRVRCKPDAMTASYVADALCK